MPRWKKLKRLTANWLISTIRTRRGEMTRNSKKLTRPIKFFPTLKSVLHTILLAMLTMMAVFRTDKSKPDSAEALILTIFLIGAAVFILVVLKTFLIYFPMLLAQVRAIKRSH